jgi:phytoene dehydrogenase-like protein
MYAPGFFIPYRDGTSVILYENMRLFEEEMKKFAPEDIEGWKRLLALVERYTIQQQPNNLKKKEK